MFNLNFLKKRMIPKVIEAKIIYPQEVLTALENKRKKGSVNDENSFMSVAGSHSGHHAGFVELVHNQKVRLTYSDEGFWYELSVNEMNTLKGAKDYYYNFETNYIKAKYLEQVKVIEWGLPNKRKDGILREVSNFILTFHIDEPITISIQEASLSKILEAWKIISQDYNLDIVDVSYNENQISKEVPTDLRTVTGSIQLISGNEFSRVHNDNKAYIDFSIEAQNII